jgi:hypothetical protein
VKTLIRVITAAAICLAAQSAFSQTTFGRTDCGKWLTNPDGAKTLNKAWLLGYLSGLSVSGIAKNDPFDALSSAAQAYVWMDNFCKANPLSDISEGGAKLFAELTEKAKARK